MPAPMPFRGGLAGRSGGGRASEHPERQADPQTAWCYTGVPVLPISTAMTTTPRHGRSQGGDAPGDHDHRRRRPSRSGTVLGALAGAVLALLLGVSSIVTRRAEDAAARDHTLLSAAQ